MLDRSRKPLVIAGIGAWRAGARDAIVDLADRCGAALASTLKSKDMFRDHPFNCGIIGGFSHSAGRKLIEQADCVVVFGASLNQRTTSFGGALPGGVPVIHVDADRASTNRFHGADVTIIGDAKAVAQALAERQPRRKPEDMPLRTEALARMLAEFDLASEFAPQHTARTVDPRSAALALDAMLPRQRNVVWDVGNFFQTASLVSVPDPSHHMQTNESGSIGLGIGAALGFAVGKPDVPTVLLVGDGGLLMTLGELETTVREDIPLVVMLMNDCAYGAELHYLKENDMPVSTSKFPDIDFAPVAEGFGFTTVTVRTMDELMALRPILAKPEGPIFIDCKINGACPAPFVAENAEHERRSR